jgi:hypothetical protein
MFVCMRLVSVLTGPRLQLMMIVVMPCINTHGIWDALDMKSSS